MSEQQDRLSSRDVITLRHDITLSDSDSEEELTSVPFDPEVKTLSSSDDEEDGDDDGGGGAAGRPLSSASGPRSASFSLRGGSTSFSSRSRSIFDSLDSAAKAASSSLGQDNVIDGVFARPPPPPPLLLAPSSSNGRRPRGGAGGGGGGGGAGGAGGGGAGGGGGGGGSITDRSPTRVRGRDSGGAGSCVRRGGGVPDYLLHPERWTCYSLEDVPDTSEAENRTAAHQYLSSLQHRKERTHEEEEEDEAFVPAYNQGQNQSDCRSSKILFSRPGRVRAQQEVSAGREKEKEKEKALRHLQEDQGKEEDAERGRNDSDGEEEEDVGRPTIRPPVGGAQDAKRKRKQPAGSEEMEEEEGEEHEKSPAGGGVFMAFRKSSSRKNYRRTSEHDGDQ